MPSCLASASKQCQGQACLCWKRLGLAALQPLTMPPEDPGRHVFLLLGCTPHCTRPRLQANVIGRQRATQAARTAQPRVGIPATIDSFLQWQCWLSPAVHYMVCDGQMHVTSDHGCHPRTSRLSTRLESPGVLVGRHDPWSWMGSRWAGLLSLFCSVADGRWHPCLASCSHPGRKPSK